MKIRSLFWRLTLPPLIALLLGGLLLGYLIPDKVYRNQLEQERIQLGVQAEILEEVLVKEWRDSQFNAIARDWASRIDGNVLIFSQSGNIIGASTQPASPNIIFLRPEIEMASSSGIGYDMIEGQGSTPDTILLAQQVILDGQKVGFIHFSYELNQIAQTRDSLRKDIWLGLLAIALIVEIPLVIFAASTSQRLKLISEAASQITAGNFRVTLFTGIQDEIGKLASVINKLAVRLDHQLTSLREEQHTINAVLHQMNEGVIILDGEGKINLINPAAKEIFGINDKLLPGNGLIRVIQNHQILELWENYSETGEIQSSLIEMHDLSKIIQASILPLEGSNEDLSLLVVQDLTQLRVLQTIRQDFISNISHELRTPIASLKALTETLQISALDDPEAARRFLNRMEIEIEALAQMVSELLELTRIESGQVPLELQRVDANEIIRTSVERIAVQAERANLTLSYEPTEDPVFILADPPRMEQVLVNILHNAIKFTPSGGKISTSIKTRGGTIHIMIQDNGPGIPIEDRPRIFERFYKSKRPKHGSGTGLGLSIAKHLVEAHGGTIWVESQLGEGSTFFIQLPRQ